MICSFCNKPIEKLEYIWMKLWSIGWGPVDSNDKNAELKTLSTHFTNDLKHMFCDSYCSTGWHNTK